MEVKSGTKPRKTATGEELAAASCAQPIAYGRSGDMWTSLRCDCRQQLEKSLEYIRAQESGAVIYLRQEGRGIGLFNPEKIEGLQKEGITVTRRIPMVISANEHNDRYLQTKRERLGHLLD